MKRFMITLLIGVLAVAAVAQPPAPDHWRPDPQDMRRERIHERIEAMRIWKLTEALNLDADRATIFFPRYRLYLATIDSLEMQRMDAMETLRYAVDNDSTMDYAVKVKTIQQVSRKILDQQESFLKQNRDLLSDKEVAAFMVFEFRFHERLRDIIRDLRMEQAPPPMPPGRDPGDRPRRR